MARLVRGLAWTVAFAGVIAVAASTLLYIRIEAAPLLLFAAFGAASTWYGSYVARKTSVEARPIERLEALLDS